MKRKLLCLCTFAALSFTLASCHGTLVSKEDLNKTNDTTSFEVPDSFDTTRQYEISFWAKNDNNKTQRIIYESAIESFEKIYPNIHVNITSYTDYTTIYNDVIKNIPTKTTPNVCVAYPDNVATYRTGENVIAPLNELIDNDKYGLGGNDISFDSVDKSEVISKFLEEGKIGSNYYTLPFMRSTEALYVNKTYLLENGFTIPEVFTWDYIWEICQYAEEKSHIDNTIMYPLIYKSTDNMFIQLTKQYGYDYSTEKGEVKFLSDDVNSMLLNLADKADKGYFDTFKRVSYPGNFYNKEQCIFAIDSTAGSTWIGSKAPLLDIPQSEVVQFETMVSPIPQVDVSNPQMISQGPSLCLFNKEDNQEVLASWIFMQYLLTNEIQISYAKTEGYVPVTSKAIESNEFASYMSSTSEYDVKLAATKLIIDNVDNTFITPVFNGSSSVRSAAGYLIEAIFNQNFRSKESINNLFASVNTRYKLSTYVIN